VVAQVVIPPAAKFIFGTVLNFAFGDRPPSTAFQPLVRRGAEQIAQIIRDRQPPPPPGGGGTPGINPNAPPPPIVGWNYGQYVPGSIFRGSKGPKKRRKVKRKRYRPEDYGGIPGVSACGTDTECDEFLRDWPKEADQILETQRRRRPSSDGITANTFLAPSSEGRKARRNGGR